MSFFRNLRIGASHHRVMLVFAIYNLATGIRDTVMFYVAPSDDQPWHAAVPTMPVWGLLGLALAALLLGKFARVGAQLTRAAREFQDQLNRAGPRGKTRQLVGLRAYALANGISKRKVAFIAGMTVKAVEDWTTGAKAALSDDEREKVRVQIQEWKSLDAAWAKANKAQRMRLRIAALALAVIGAAIGYEIDFNPIVLALTPVVIITAYWWILYGTGPKGASEIRSIQYAVFGKEVPKEVRLAAGHLVD